MDFDVPEPIEEPSHPTDSFFEMGKGVLKEGTHEDLGKSHGRQHTTNLGGGNNDGLFFDMYRRDGLKIDIPGGAAGEIHVSQET